MDQAKRLFIDYEDYCSSKLDIIFFHEVAPSTQSLYPRSNLRQHTKGKTDFYSTRIILQTKRSKDNLWYALWVIDIEALFGFEYPRIQNSLCYLMKQCIYFGKEYFSNFNYLFEKIKDDTSIIKILSAFRKATCVALVIRGLPDVRRFLRIENDTGNLIIWK